MARKIIHNACMFCDQFPCICNPVAPKKPAARKKAASKKSEPVEAPVTLPDNVSVIGSTTPNMVLDAMRAAAAAASEVVEAEVKAKVDAQQVVRDDPEAVAAIGNLRDILSPEEIKNYDFVFTPEGAKTRAEVWKERNGKHQ